MNEFLKAVQKEFSAAGLPVYDAEGKLVGRTGQDPKAEPEPTAVELITRGFQQHREEAEREMVPILESLSGYALEARRVLDRTSQWDFRKRLEAERKCGELYEKFKAAKKEIEKLRSKAIGSHLEQTPYLKSVDSFMQNLERHFTENVPFVLGRF